MKVIVFLQIFFVLSRSYRVFQIQISKNSRTKNGEKEEFEAEILVSLEKIQNS